MSPEIPPYDEAPEEGNAAVSEVPEPLPPPRPAAAPPPSGAVGAMGAAGAGTAPKALARVEPLNLAGRPFLNSRPVVRVSLLLLALGIVLLIGNVSRFLSYREASADKRAQIARGDAEIQKAQTAQSQLQKKLDSFDLEQQNLKIDFLNRQIENRTFSWSTLLDRIAERLPHGVRLNRLAPLTGEKAERELQRSRHSTTRGTRAADQVTLAITGEDRDDEALMAFVDAFYKPPFSYPDLVREEPAENKAENGKPEDAKLKKFELNVQYHPGASGAKLPAGAAAAGVTPRLEELPSPKPAKGGRR
jgi:Tfp pilus assembly protein PilN